MGTIVCPSCNTSQTPYSHLATSVFCINCGFNINLSQQAKPTAAKTEKLHTNPQPFAYRTVPMQNIPTRGQSSIGGLIFAIVGPIAAIVILFFVLIGAGVVFIANVNRKSPKTRPVYNPYPSPSPYSTPTIPSTRGTNKNGELMTFGGEGTGSGLFKNANEVAVDEQGNIYVADETLRVQRFDFTGKYLNIFTVPQNSQHYKNAEAIDKIAVDRNGKIYVLVGGVIFQYDTNTGQQTGTVIKVNHIEDFILRPDGGMVLITSRDNTDILIWTNAEGKQERAVNRFMSTPGKAIFPNEALRLAVDGAGNVYSIFAVSDAYGEFSFNDEHVMIYRYTPEGKYVDRFGSYGSGEGQYNSPCAIAVDNQGRIYVAETFKIVVYEADGRLVKEMKLEMAWIRSITLDKDNNIYAVARDKVIKYEPVK